MRRNVSAASSFRKQCRQLSRLPLLLLYLRFVSYEGHSRRHKTRTMSMLPPGIAPPGLMSDAPGGRKPPPRKPVDPQLAVIMFVVFVGLGGAMVAQLTPHASMIKFHDGPHQMPTRPTIHQNYFEHAKQRERPMYKPPSHFIFHGWVLLHAVAGFGGYLCWVRFGFSGAGRNAIAAHVTSVASHALWLNVLFTQRALNLSVWMGRVSTVILIATVLIMGKARFESGAMHVPLLFATWKLAEFTNNVAAVNL